MACNALVNDAIFDCVALGPWGGGGVNLLLSEKNITCFFFFFFFFFFERGVLGLHFGLKKTGKLSIVFENLSRNSVFFRTEVKP